MRRIIWLGGLALLSLAAPAGAQRTPPGRGAAVDRPALEQRFRERLGALMRQRLALDDEQARRLGELNARFESRRRTMFQDERAVRLGLRRALMEDSTASNEEVASLLDRALRLQRQRVELMEEEQRDLAQFLTPVQRARYFGMQEQLRRQMDEMRNRRLGPEGGVGQGLGPARRRRPGGPPG